MKAALHKTLEKIAAFGSSYIGMHILVGAAEGCDLLIFLADLQVNKTGHLRQMTDGRAGGCLLLSLRYTARPSAGTSGHFSYNQATQPAWLVVL
ncbi:hypothetical protein [Pseudomonas sp. AIG]